MTPTYRKWLVETSISVEEEVTVNHFEIEATEREIDLMTALHNCMNHSFTPILIEEGN